MKAPGRGFSIPTHQQWCPLGSERVSFPRRDPALPLALFEGLADLLLAPSSPRFPLLPTPLDKEKDAYSLSFHSTPY